MRNSYLAVVLLIALLTVSLSTTALGQPPTYYDPQEFEDPDLQSACRHFNEAWESERDNYQPAREHKERLDAEYAEHFAAAREDIGEAREFTKPWADAERAGLSLMGVFGGLDPWWIMAILGALTAGGVGAKKYSDSKKGGAAKRDPFAAGNPPPGGPAGQPLGQSSERAEVPDAEVHDTPSSVSGRRAAASAG